jgi:uncharacterized protein
MTLIDADVHPVLPPGALEKRLSERWRRYHEDFGFRFPRVGHFYPRVRGGGVRMDAWPANGRPGSDLELLRSQLLDEHGIDYAVLTPLDGPGFGAERTDYAIALTRAVNEWIREDWLDEDARLRGSIGVPVEDPAAAVAELEHWAADPRFVQVLLPVSTREPLGSTRYWPLYEAAAARGLPVAFHNGGYDAHPGAGWPSYYIEEHTNYANVMQTQVQSLIVSGVFEAVPNLQTVFIEGGVTWAGPMMWALDAGWSMLREEVAHLTRPPSAYVREHCWFTTQPIEEPDDPRDLALVLELMGVEDRILFATDYPHWDFDSPAQALPRALGDELRTKIRGANAARLYELPGVEVAA